MHYCTAESSKKGLASFFFEVKEATLSLLACEATPPNYIYETCFTAREEWICF